MRLGRSFRVRRSGGTWWSRWHRPGSARRCQSPGDGHQGLTFRSESREWVGLNRGLRVFCYTEQKTSTLRTEPSQTLRRSVWRHVKASSVRKASASGGSNSAEHPPPSDVPGDSYLENQVDTSPGGPRSAGASTDGYTPGNLPPLHKRNTPLNATVRLTVFTVTLLSGRENAR